MRSVNGPEAAWFRGTRSRHEDRIQAGGVDRDVSFEDVGGEIDDRIDTAYRAKYRRYAQTIIDSIVSPRARPTTLRLVPR